MHVYILKCEGNVLYTGIAVNPEKRLRQHLGLIKGGAKFTRTHKVQSVMAIWQDRSGEYARKLECQIKKLTRSGKEQLVNAPDTPFAELGIDIPSEEFLYVNPNELNRKYNLKLKEQT